MGPGARSALGQRMAGPAEKRGVGQGADSAGFLWSGGVPAFFLNFFALRASEDKRITWALSQATAPCHRCCLPAVCLEGEVLFDLTFDPLPVFLCQGLSA